MGRLFTATTAATTTDTTLLQGSSVTNTTTTTVDWESFFHDDDHDDGTTTSTSTGSTNSIQYHPSVTSHKSAESIPRIVVVIIDIDIERRTQRPTTTTTKLDFATIVGQRHGRTTATTAAGIATTRINAVVVVCFPSHIFEWNHSRIVDIIIIPTVTHDAPTFIPTTGWSRGWDDIINQLQ
jgi:hypothetical protein